MALHNYAHIIKEIRKHNWDVKLADQTDDMTILSVQGPLSRDLLQSLTQTDLSNEAFPFSTHQILEVAGHKLRALRVSFVGEMGESSRLWCFCANFFSFILNYLKHKLQSTKAKCN